ncbi:16S rRNA (adenine(1518)-N(6)/adenine(1519)-N(6))-dimethyltransferase [Chloroflexi bacterium TSY]|nr:16S rRNA (adenine(1518)-N(6)/adenine(1519)-N(6))-dimethyltransferase [Chloroflexi bacterium TSY]
MLTYSLLCQPISEPAPKKETEKSSKGGRELRQLLVSGIDRQTSRATGNIDHDKKSYVFDYVRSADLKPKKSLGQNFVIDESYLETAIAAAKLTKQDTVLEIGPGLGGLTNYLATLAGRIVAVELDDRLVSILNKRFETEPHVSIVHGDILKTSLDSLLDYPVVSQNSPVAALGTRKPDKSAFRCDCDEDMVFSTALPDQAQPRSHPEHGFAVSHDSQVSYKVVANLPYYITNAVLRYLFESPNPPQRAVVMVQKEVAQRICASPGNMSLLAVSLQLYSHPQIVDYVPAQAFYPRPKVDSAILRLDLLDNPAIPDIDPTQFFRIVRAGFSQKRKQLLNSLNGGLHLSKDQIAVALNHAGIDVKRRAQTLSLVEWGTLYRALESQF